MTFLALTKLSMREFLRDRIVWMGLFVAFLLFVVSLFLGALSFAEQQRILNHIGWSAIQISTLAMGLVLAANWLQKEIDRQTCLIVLVRPMSRDQFLLGKFLPIILLIGGLQIVLSFFLWALGGFILPALNILTVLWGTFLEVSTVLAITFCLSVFIRPSLSFMAGLGIFLIGHWSQEIEFFGNKTQSLFYVGISKIGQYFFPNLFQFNWRSFYFLEKGVSIEQIVWVTTHSFAWIALAIVLSLFIFRRKDLV